MTYALGRRVESYDMPAIRADRARRRGEERSHVGVHSRASSTAPRSGWARVAPVETTTTSHGRRTVQTERAGDAMFITKKHISRRTVLRGMGVTMALPLLEAMVPARTAFAQDGRRQGAPRRDRDGARLGRRHHVRPRRRTCGRRRRSGTGFDLVADAAWRRSSRSATT